MDKLSWNAQKKELWKLKPNVLMEKLQELQTEKMKLEVTLRMGGKTSKRYGYHSVSKQGYNVFSNLKNIRHRIGCIKTMLNVKLLRKQ